MRVVFAAAEIAPIAQTGGLGEVCGSLPKALAASGHDVTLFMPLHRQARSWFEQSGAPLDVVAPAEEITWGGWTAQAGFLRATLPGSDISLYLIANDPLFDRDSIYGMRADGYDDGFERFTFFCRAVIRGCELFGIAPDIVHAHDWHTALLPVYLHSGLRGNGVFASARSVYTIHNLNYQGVTTADRFGLTGLHSRYWAPDALEHYGELNPMKAGILTADQVTTVSPHYAVEIQTPQYGAGLDGVLRAVGHKLTGILNGIDTDEWSPATDEHLASNYDSERLSGKVLSKRALLREAKLRYRGKTPLMAIVSRLVDQKGFHLVTPILSQLLRLGTQAVILGSGEPAVEEAFRAIENENPDLCRTWIGFDNALAHRIYAAADLLLMPSMYEPCGLNQMYALRYGTLPVVRMTGGLVDTVSPFDGTNDAVANGFGFQTPSPADCYAAVWLAILNYRDGKTWRHLQRNGMSADYSWSRSAHAYETIYRKAVES